MVVVTAQAEDDAPPRPPLPHLYDYEETPPVVPPLPKETSVIRHTSVRGLKRQSDERKRDREGGHCVVNGDCKVFGTRYKRRHNSSSFLCCLSHTSIIVIRKLHLCYTQWCSLCDMQA